jgi:(E)-4-hydroxy-3-methylbut-2-enyl-diphosphate synthase
MAVGALFIDRKATKLVLKFADNSAFLISHSSFLIPLADAILQAARIKFTKTEYISCPGCGRTLFNLQETIAKVKAATKDLVGLKIGIMGCIVNGPGEMADADYGYVGAGRGKISLYKGKTCIEKSIPEAEAVDKLIEFIRKDRA